jgi:alanyl-tRNA synthetase
MLSQKIRRQFLQYFKDKQHAIVNSSSVVPHDDPTLLFTNAGMNQFKDVFLGHSERDYKRAATSQKCIRVGGKHNDLENVGHTRRHLTFFEMLGNFSFGDYFKEEAIRLAWEVSTQVFEFDPGHIWPTVYTQDKEAFEIWRQYVPAERITKMGEKDNFWAMGETGPCGPCSELYYDRGKAYGEASDPANDAAGERYLEYWNLVFMQYNRLNDGTLLPLPKPSIDTGAGLERIISLKLNVDSVFDTDILKNLIKKVEEVSGLSYDYHDTKLSAAFRVIADHLRCLSFAIADGVQPSNVERGYVLRKVLRRAVRYGRMLGIEKPFLSKILPNLIESMGRDYVELEKGKQRIEEILNLEEEAFLRTLHRGGNILNNIIDRAQTDQKLISGEDAFKLKDTYGLPIEEILLIAKDNALAVDQQRYAVLENEAKERSRPTQKNIQQMAGENLFVDYIQKEGSCHFLGFGQFHATGRVTAIVVEGKLVDEIKEGREGMIVLDNTPFYAEMGGQIGDIGTLKENQILFNVKNCIAPYKGVIAHVGKLEKGFLKIGMPVLAEIDKPRRQKISNNHTATHLMHWALHKALGEHVKQAGSVVDEGKLRFDFSHHKPVTQEEVDLIEDLVNEKIRDNQPVSWYEIPYEEAQKQSEIKQFFGEKYSSIVRVVDIGCYSKELCGGTHTAATGDLGFFRIAKESSIAAGVRRIEAMTGLEAALLSRESDKTIIACSSALKAQPNKLLEKIEKLMDENKHLGQELKTIRKSQLMDLVTNLISKVETIHAIPFLAAELRITFEELRYCADEILRQRSSLILILASAVENKCHVIARVSEDLIGKGFNAQDIIKSIAPIIEGSGGGKANSAQAGGTATHKINEALAYAKGMIQR